MSQDPQTQGPDVVEHGGYSEQGVGPEADTTAYASDLPQDAGSPPPTDRRGRKAARFIARDRLARRDGPPPPAPEAAPVRRVPLMTLMVLAFVGLCAVGVALAVALSRPATPPPPPQARQAELPDQIDGVPVRRGLRRAAD